MKTLARRLWEEPALFLTVLAAGGELGLELLGASGVLKVITPVIAGLGIRQVVAPTTREDPTDPQVLAPERFEQPVA